MGNDESRKRRIFEIVEASKERDFASRAYDTMIVTAVIVGLIPLTIKSENFYTKAIDIFTVSLFIIDYIIRLYTSDFKMGYKSYKSYFAYILTPMALVDFMSILPIMAIFIPASKILALTRVLRVARVLKVLRYMKTMRTIGNVMRRIRGQLMAVLLLVVIYTVSAALIMFQTEPDTFNTFFDALYWSAISISTTGYGDITPVTDIGRAIAALSSLIGVAIIALPTGIITAAYTEEIKRQKSKLEL
ncbi:MAG: ion transporter [Lachnospiraceae bacterium]|nr:ion transporter [Lachnospiraceae bacterium]